LNDTPEDRQAIQPVLNPIAAYRLSQFDGKMKNKDGKKVPSFPVQGPQVHEEIHWVNPETYFDQLPEISGCQAARGVGFRQRTCRHVFFCSRHWPAAVAEALAAITTENAIAWFSHCGYSLH